MIPVEELLRPVSSENPCGEDLSYDARMMSLETLVYGGGESQFAGVEEETDWKRVFKESLVLLNECKHLRLAGYLARAAAWKMGLVSLRDALAVIRGFCENFWPYLHPQLDVTDPDPLERINIIKELADSDFLKAVSSAPLTESRAGIFSYDQIMQSKNPTADGQATAWATINAALQETPKATLDTVHTAVVEGALHLESTSTTIDSYVGAANGANLSPLINKLYDIARLLEPYTSAAAATSAAAESELAATEAASGGVASSTPKAPPGSINNRADVLDALDRITTYYQKHEPSSPIPYLMKRAKRFVDMPFIELVEEITGARKQAEDILGRDET